MNFMKKRDLAAKFSVSARTINNWMESGVVPFYRVGNVVRFDPVAVEEALKKFRVASRVKGSRE